jgi:hypothetical protein
MDANQKQNKAQAAATETDIPPCCLPQGKKKKHGSVSLRPVRLAYQPPTSSSTFLSEQSSHHQPASSTFLSE